MDITSSNSVVMLSIANLFPTPQQLQGFSADAMFATDDVEPAEVGIGVDGGIFAGYVPYLTPQTYTLRADSPSLTMFEQWLATMKATRSIYWASATITIPSIGKKYSMTKGVLTRIRAIPTAAKTMQPNEYRITWEGCDPAPV